ncbi:ring zinc finger domain superfamily protein [Nannochloropsis oceanica]
MDSDNYDTCPICSTNYPPVNAALHQARCPRQHQQAPHHRMHVAASSATAPSRASREQQKQQQQEHDHEGEEEHEKEKEGHEKEEEGEEREEATTIDLTGSSPLNSGRPTLPSIHAPAAAAAIAMAGNRNLDRGRDDEVVYDSEDDRSSDMAGSGEAAGRPKDDGVGGGGRLKGVCNEEDNEEEEDGVQIQCATCTFFNEPDMDICQMCMAPLTNQAGGGGGGGMEEQENDVRELNAHARWTCPLCTYGGNTRGNWICQACEVGRPRRQDMLGSTNNDGYVMVSPDALSRGSGGWGRQRGGGRGGAQGMLEAVVTGALFGGGAAGLGSALAGGTRADSHRRMLMGSLVGGLGGGILGSQFQQMTMIQQQDAVDRMSYEDLLNLFGPGHEPQKASEVAVSALPEVTVSSTELERMRRESMGNARDCSVCMEEFELGDVTRRLPCLHTYHKACIDRWLLQCNAMCPICKVPIAQT